MKIIAMYLPQYHRTEENDMWWGEGFTDWVSTQKARPLFDNHVQPKKPLDKNYYDLLKKETMVWQCGLMKKYGIDGMCMYHYWFADGKQVLEKPIENLLHWKDIDMPFCLCWANETWARSWGNIKNSNMWSYVEEPVDKSGKQILLEQNYGGTTEWLKHIEYLIQCFKDKRYIRIDDKPVLIIYKPGLIVELKKMISVWQHYLEKNGIKGIYIIGSNAPSVCENIVDGILFHEPALSLEATSAQRDKTGILKYNYTELWENILKNFNSSNVKTYYSGVVNFDDTPRRGEKGVVIEGGTPELFEKYLEKLLKKNQVVGNDITFINAWNEWGEGMYLEPDTNYGYEYLEAVKNAKSNYYKLDYDFEPDFRHWLNITKRKCNINEININILDSWMALGEKKITIYQWFEKNKINEYAIYGYSLLAKHLKFQLDGSNVKLKYIIDQNKNVCSDIDVYSPNDVLPEIAIIVVCTPFYYGNVREMLEGKMVKKIISIETIIDELDKI